MATAYHLEALRRQRLIDRTVQAKRKLAAIEKKLHEEEKILHDSNLVQGYIDPIKELEERVSSRSLVAS